MTTEKMLRTILYLIVVHSFCVGVVLIILPAEMFLHFGYYPVSERFFPVQGGVFHIIMSIAYFMAARRFNREHGLIIITIVAKISAAFFLMFYFIFVSAIWVVFISGVLDALMGIITWLLFKKYLNAREPIA